MVLSPTASVLALFSFNSAPPDNTTFGAFHRTITSYFARLSVNPTYIGATGKGYSAKLTKIPGRTHSRLLRSKFSGLLSLSIAANPSGSDAPAFDSFALATFDYFEARREVVVCVVINEHFVDFKSTEYDCLLRTLLKLWRWDYGFGYADKVANSPELYVFAANSDQLAGEDARLMTAWYEASAETRRSCIRDVYAYNVLNEAQLEHSIKGGASLRSVILQDQESALEELGEGLHLWRVLSSPALMRLRRELRSSPLVIH